MDIYMIILRLVHIFAGIFWVGSGLFMALVIVPAMRNMGGGQLMQGILRYSNYHIIIGVAAILTTVAGLLMYAQLAATLGSGWMSSRQGIVLSIGAVAGLLAFGHGMVVLGKLTRQMRAVAMEINGPPTEAQRNILLPLQARMSRNANIMLVLMIISVAGMASARYF